MNAEPVAPLAEPVAGAATPPTPELTRERQHFRKCVKCGKHKRYSADRRASEFPYYAHSQTWSTWCKQCYGEAASVGNKMRKARRAGDQAGALIPGEGELQRSVRRGDTLMSVSRWIEQGVGALVLLSGEAVYQFETRDDGMYVRILRRAPLSRLTPVDVETFRWLRGEEEGVFYQ